MIDMMKNLAREAGTICVNEAQGLTPGDVALKGERDLVTKVDRQVEAFLIKEIARAWPDHGIVGEETGVKKSPGQYRWVIDPIDGTTSYVHGQPCYSISLALQKDCETVAGVVYAPALDQLFHAEKEGGAWLNDRPIQVSSCSRLMDALLATGFACLREGFEKNNLVYLNRILPRVRDIRRCGSAALDLAYVAAGKYDGFWEMNLNIYDVAAGALLVEEAGGRVSDLHGGGRFPEEGILAGNPGLADRLLGFFVEDALLPREAARSDENQTGVSAIREVFDYIRRFKGHIFVLKIEDSLTHHPLFPLFMKDMIRLQETGIKIVLVPGIRDTIERNRKQAGFETQFVKGIRVTSSALMPHVKLAAMEVAENLISHLAAGGANGIMGNWIRARSIGVRDGVDFEWTGQVEKVRGDIVTRLLDQSFIPVVHPIGFNAVGGCYNLSATQVACRLCMDLPVSKLFFIGEDGGISARGLSYPQGTQVRAGGCFSNLDRDEVNTLLKLNRDKLSFQEREYLESAVAVTSRERVRRVHIISGTREGSLLKEVFSSAGGGTMIYRNRYAHIRRAKAGDVPEIMQLLDGYVQKGNLVPRTQAQVLDTIQNYCIYEVDKAVYGCGAICRLDDTSGEIGAIAVNEAYKSRGGGSGLMENLIRQGRDQGYTRLFLMTTRAADWFYGFGFLPATPEDLPQERRKSYNRSRNSRVLMLNLERG